MANSGITIVLDQSCDSLTERLTGYPVFVHQSDVRTATDVAVTELRNALCAGTITRPYLLVGASFAGLTALLYAYQYPQEVAGILLLDSSHPRQSEVARAALSEVILENAENTAFRKFVGGFGPTWDYSRRLFDDLGPLGDIPLIALAAEKPPMPACLPDAVQNRLTQDWHALQKDHARRSSRGEMRVVTGSGHEITKVAPDVVIDTIKEMVLEIANKPNS